MKLCSFNYKFRFKKMKEYLKLSEYEYEIAMRDFIYKDYRHLTDFLNLNL
jgi:hypothetical protein